ncbi:rhodanese-like domain-containing protein [Nitriliruptoraceae bacterium ZYF776]|nr:rhodanese-like domain-containing protein [Profundirhabdus halotolerans]
MRRTARTSRRASRIAAVAVAGSLLAGCGGDGGAPADAGAADASAGTVSEVVDAQRAVELLGERDDLTVIDVRTPEEHVAGHLDGAVLLDVAGGTFDAEVGDLDRDGAYLLYCRTGNRSAQAAATMAELGFVEVYDAGAFDDLAAAGAPTG